VHWIVASGVPAIAAKITRADQLSMSFIDVLASCDAVLTKVGYGTFVEAACNGVAIISLPRPDWPETTVLAEWAAENANFAWIEDLEDTAVLASTFCSLLSQSRSRVSPSGISEAVNIIAQAQNCRKA
jgi:hypothetical protein